MLLMLFLFLINIENSFPANILVVIPYAVKSHYIMQRPIGLELARRGHNVTVLTPYKEVHHPPTYHQVMVSDSKIWQHLGKSWPNRFELAELSAQTFHTDILYNGCLNLTESTLKQDNIQRFLRINQTFDLVITEQFFQEAYYILAHKYNAPLILISSFGISFKHNIATRNPLQLATLPYEFYKIENPYSFWGRLRNACICFIEYLWWRFWFLEEQEKLVKNYVSDLAEPVPSLYEMQMNVSLYLSNSHFSYDLAAAYLPNIIEIGGIHIEENASRLPDDLQIILDNASYGVLYVNFGSVLTSTQLPLEKRNAFLNVFRRLKQTVLWKWENDTLTNKPDNVVIRKWLPQNEILAHPNVKVFITHGGLMSTLEAVFHGVPIIGIPIYGDQYNNLLQTEDIGNGKILPYHDINQDNLNEILNAFLNSDLYTEKAKELSIVFRDRPLQALNSAVYWIEYIIRHKGANFMKNPALKLSWIAYNMLDVYSFIVFIVLLKFIMIFILLKMLWNRIFIYFRTLSKCTKRFKIKHS